MSGKKPRQKCTCDSAPTIFMPNTKNLWSMRSRLGIILMFFATNYVRDLKVELIRSRNSCEKNALYSLYELVLNNCYDQLMAAFKR